jgi:4'-phosphopantetheinyl transferase
MTPDFEQTVKHALARAGFGASAAHAYCVLVFNSTVFIHHATAAQHWLDGIERVRANRFRFEPDRNTYVLAHAYWRIALGIFLGIETAAVPLAMAEAGQPSLPGTGAATSLSHSGSWVAVAIGKSSTIGVDIESLPNNNALDQLASTICTQGEIDDLEKSPPLARHAAMLALWTRKEALLKAFGSGLLAEPSTVSANAGEIIIPPPSAPIQTCCHVCNISLPTNLVGALATPADTKYPLRLYLHDTHAIDGVVSPT